MTPYLQARTLYPPLIHNRPSINLGLVVVIPAYDEPFLLLSLGSLKKCRPPESDVEVIVVVNDSEADSVRVKSTNRRVYLQVLEWAAKHSRPKLKFHILYEENMPRKHAGVGLARKIGMDEACWRLERAGNPSGIIACFDADSRCDPGYFRALEAHFSQNPNSPACGVYFEHPLSGADYEESVYQAIAAYELHLRYYVHAQRFAGFPYAVQTIGSSMAVRCSAYQQQGGMNRRKAGEDFYFIHKFTPLGGFAEIMSTRVIPSPRPSHRVPFGTGNTVKRWLKRPAEYQTYNPQSFEELKCFLGQITFFHQADTLRASTLISSFPESIRTFLGSVSFLDKLEELQGNTSNQQAFTNRFFRWFNAFMVMKYVHFSRDHYYPNVDVETAARWLLLEVANSSGLPPDFNHQKLQAGDLQSLLIRFRELDRGRPSPHDGPSVLFP